MAVTPEVLVDYLLRGSFANAVNSLLCLPLSIAQQRAQLQGSGVWDQFCVPYQQPSGWSFLWRPFVFNFLRTLPNQTISMDAVSWLRFHYRGFSFSYEQFLWTDGVMVALIALIGYPFAVAQNFLLTTPTKFMGFWDLFKNQGVSIYNGVNAMLLELVPYKVIHFTLCTTFYHNNKQKSELQDFLVGQVFASFAKLLLYPLNTISRCQQLTGKGMVSTVSEIYQNFGVSGFFGGVHWYIAQYILYSVIVELGFMVEREIRKMYRKKQKTLLGMSNKFLWG